MASLTLKHVFKKYPNRFEAVKDLNLEIEDKEFIVFFGPSGCGKSTALRMIAGLEDISSGELYIDGELANDVEPKNRDIAMVFQNCTLYPNMTVKENLSFGLQLCKVPNDEIERRVNETAELLELTHLLERKPNQLSGIQRQRAAMGRAMVRKPKVLLMDEPLANLDAELRGQMRMEIAGLHRRLGTTIIYVTQDQAEAMMLGTRIVVMKDGAVQQVDAPQNLYDHPVNQFVAGLIGEPQMNLIDMQVEKRAENVSLSFGGNTIPLSRERGKLLEERGYIGKTVILGIRPEDLHAGEITTGAAGSVTIEVTIRGCEIPGTEEFLYFDVEDTGCIARVNPAITAEAGDVVKLALDMNRIHLFDKDTEKVIR